MCGGGGRNRAVEGGRREGKKDWRVGREGGGRGQNGENGERENGDQKGENEVQIGRNMM